MLNVQASKSGTVYFIVYQGEAINMTSRYLHHWLNTTIKTSDEAFVVIIIIIIIIIITLFHDIAVRTIKDKK